MRCQICDGLLTPENMLAYIEYCNQLDIKVEKEIVRKQQSWAKNASVLNHDEMEYGKTHVDKWKD
tara:strand:+ start:504 stop:698 length:195 start_codon:yes stop_codon:yes gene_type:complete